MQFFSGEMRWTSGKCVGSHTVGHLTQLSGTLTITLFVKSRPRPKELNEVFHFDDFLRGKAHDFVYQFLSLHLLAPHLPIVTHSRVGWSLETLVSLTTAI